jgi:GNAT superfamily N-acetyltransferase
MDALFANHLRFMAHHRGSVRRSGRDIHIEGPTEDLTSFVPGGEDSAVDAACPAVRVAPWSGDGWPDRLTSAGYVQAGVLSYMELANPFAAFAQSAPITVRLARDRAHAAAFADVQAAGFLSGDGEEERWWRRYFPEPALSNINEPNQRFYLGFSEGVAVASTLALRSSGVVGIYAVATVPACRRRGFATALLECARRDALEAGLSRIILQAHAGSDAESSYVRLGFFIRYQTPVWRRTTKAS